MADLDILQPLKDLLAGNSALSIYTMYTEDVPENAVLPLLFVRYLGASDSEYNTGNAYIQVMSFEFLLMADTALTITAIQTNKDLLIALIRQNEAVFSTPSVKAIEITKSGSDSFWAVDLTKNGTRVWTEQIDFEFLVQMEDAV